MTECPKCKGYGIIGDAVPDILRGRGYIFSSIECPQCNGTGEVPMTNEEYLKSCNTEQLAEILFQEYCNGRNEVNHERRDTQTERKGITESMETIFEGAE